MADGSIDTVVLAIVDMQGRLQGKRFDAQYFLNDVLEHGTEGCNYLLAVDIEMNTVDGYAISSWDRGYGDFVMAPDLATLRNISLAARHRAAARRRRSGSTARRWSNRRGRSSSASSTGWPSAAGAASSAPSSSSSLFDDSFEQAFDKRYTDLRPSNQYNLDYSILATSRVEPLLRAIRLGMRDAGMQVESAKGECNLGPARDRVQVHRRARRPATTT